MSSKIEGFEYIGEIGEWDYSWACTGVWKRGHRYFYADDSGCSCNGPWEDLTEGDLVPATKDEIRQHLRTWVRAEHGYGPKRDEVEAFIKEHLG